jgi:FAS-associated factor 2
VQDLTGIEDISVCRDVLQRHAWDLEVSVQDQLNMREGRPSVFVSDIHTPAVVNDHSAQRMFFSSPRDHNPRSIRGFFSYIVSLVLRLCYNAISNILQFTFRHLQPDPRRCEYCKLGASMWSQYIHHSLN